MITIQRKKYHFFCFSFFRLEDNSEVHKVRGFVKMEGWYNWWTTIFQIFPFLFFLFKIVENENQPHINIIIMFSFLFFSLNKIKNNWKRKIDILLFRNKLIMINDDEEEEEEEDGRLGEME